MSDTRKQQWNEDPRVPFLVALGLQGLLETLPDLAFACDAGGNLLWAGGVFESLTGRPVSESVGRPVLSFLSPPARRTALRAIAGERARDAGCFEVTVPVGGAAGRESKVTARVLRRERSDGGTVYAGTLCEAQAGPACEPSARDRTPAVAGEAPAADAAGGGPEEAEGGMLQAGDVLATVNQEIRAPMNAMIGMARLLLQTKLDEEQQSLVDLIWKSAQSTLRIVNDAYEFTRSDAGQLDLDHIPFDLRVTVDETMTSLASLAAERGLELECRVHPAVPSRLRGDPGRLRQVLLNLGERALKTLPRGRVELLVSRLRENDRSVTLRFLVMERGAAAGDPQRSAVVPSAAGSKPGHEAGAGLGLAVIRRLAGLMGGRTGIERTSEEGCRYWFDVDLEKQEGLESTAAPRMSKAELATRRALVVDASAVARRALRSRLEDAGCRASEAGDAEEAHAVLRSAVESGDPFHFVLIDRDLPGLDGEELGAMIRADHALDVARTVMLTTVGRRGDATRARARGFSAFLPKAVGVEELVEALCEVIHQTMVTPPGGSPELVTHYSLVEGRRGKTRILLVDEDAVSQVVTQWCLGRLGYRLEIAGTLADARAAWSKTEFDIVLVDERLEDGDAPALVQELRRHETDGRHAAVIAMFRDQGSPARLAWQESGMGDFVVKPVDLVVLTGLVERLTGTGPAAGAASEEEEPERHAGRPAAPAPDKLEFVMPDVDRILTEPEMRVAMAVAMRASTASGAPVAPAPLDGPDPGACPGPPAEAQQVDTLLPADVTALEEPVAADGAAPQGVARAQVAAEAAAPEEDAIVVERETAVSIPPSATVPMEVADVELEVATPLPEPAAVQMEDVAPPADYIAEPPHLELVEAPARLEPPAPEPASAVEAEPAAAAEVGMPGVSGALLATFLGEISPFLERLSWTLSDEDARRVAAEARGLADLARSVGAVACAEGLEELERRGAEGTLKASDTVLRRCYGQGLCAASEARALLSEERRVA